MLVSYIPFYPKPNEEERRRMGRRGELNDSSSEDMPSKSAQDGSRPPGGGMGMEGKVHETHGAPQALWNDAYEHTYAARASTRAP